MSKGIGYGKTILFGEHFVVYGLPGIAGAISDCTVARIGPSEKFEFADERPCVKGYKETKKEEILRQLGAIKKFFKKELAKSQVKITLEGNLVCASGIGASAALASSIARALNEHFSLRMDDEKINEIAFEAEKEGSGNPSGIDNTVSTFGGIISFSKNLKGGKNEIKSVKTKKTLKIVLASTGITQETKKVVASVAKEREKNPERFAKIFSEYEHLCLEAILALGKGDEGKIGKLMNHNQKLLEEIGVSCSEIEEICSVARQNGALGAKLTGTGRGGLVVCLAKDKAGQEKIVKAIAKKGFDARATQLGERA